MNKVILMGRLTRDPELRHIPSGAAVASFGLAVDKYSREENTRTADFFDIVCWEKRAEFASKWLRKGTKVCLSGRLQQRQWKDKEGNNRSSVEIVVEEIEFAESKSAREGGDYPAPSAPAQNYPKPAAEPSSFQELHDDDGELPF
ncbi:MAG: single-stranded DNA-binding protein [Oscillospiraceae bacterium]|nr:single-stranded DNA-binding protein [Oscillospiraceae bacterium]